MEDSTVKYEKFATSEEKSQKSSKTVIALFVVCATLLIATVIIAVGVGMGVSMPGQVAESVQVYTLTEGELQGLYYGANGGIYFQSTINSSHIYFSVTTIDGSKTVLIIRPLNTSMTMMEINETGFLLMDIEPGADTDTTEYLIPKNSMDTMMSILTGQSNMSDEFLGQLDTENMNETRYCSLRNFAMSPEAILIIEAAKALGNLGFRGTDSSALMKFYQFALRLASARDDNSSPNNLNLKEENSRMKRSEVCGSNGATCPSGRCPYRRYDNNCFGMCGRDCTCWSFVCGDCCLHTYCETHDECCAVRGFYTFACFSVAFRRPFSRCSDTYDC